MKVTEIKPVEIGDILALTERPYHYKEVVIINTLSGKVELRQNYDGSDGPANGRGTYHFAGDPLVWTEEGLAASGASLVTDAEDIRVAKQLINLFHGVVDAVESTPARELMEFIENGLIAIPPGCQGPCWSWRNEAEAGLTAFLNERIGKEARKEVCRQLLATVENLQKIN